MTPSNKRRVALYGLCIPLTAALIYFGFYYEADADSGTLLGIAQFQIGVGMIDEASPIVDELLERDPDDLDALVLKAAVLEKRGQLEEALALYESLAGRHADRDMRAELRIAQARLLAELGKHTEAREIIEHLECVGTESRAKQHFLLALLAEDRGELENARHEIRIARKVCEEEYEFAEGREVTKSKEMELPLYVQRIKLLEQRLFAQGTPENDRNMSPADSSPAPGKSIGGNVPEGGNKTQEGSN